MRISDREIQESLRLLSERPIANGPMPGIDAHMNHLVQEQLAIIPDIRMEKVLPLRMAVKEHRYYVSEEQVAKMMLGRCVADHLR